MPSLSLSDEDIIYRLLLPSETFYDDEKELEGIKYRYLNTSKSLNFNYKSGDGKLSLISQEKLSILDNQDPLYETAEGTQVVSFSLKELQEEIDKEFQLAIKDGLNPQLEADFRYRFVSTPIKHDCNPPFCNPRLHGHASLELDYPKRGSHRGIIRTAFENLLQKYYPEIACIVVTD